MTRGRGTASVVASPVLVGAVTTLIVIVSVFLAYNANKGLPFVPTYRMVAEMRDAQGLIAANEVTVGGSRVGVVDSIEPQLDSKGRTYARVALKLSVDRVESNPQLARCCVR